MNFSSGDSVSARIPGSRAYSDGKIKTIKGDSCIVYFPLAEKEFSIPKSELIVGPITSSRNRSPARKSPSRTTRSPGRPKSPSRQQVAEPKANEKSKSPSRTTRPKSPSRKEKSPSRKEAKSTTKAEKSPRKEKYPARKSPSRNARKDKNTEPPKSRKSKDDEPLSSRKDSTTEPESESEKDPFLNRFRNRSRKRSDDEKQTARVSPLNTVNGVVEKVSSSIGVMTRRALRTASQPKEIEKIIHYQDTIEQIYRNEFSDNEVEPVFETFKTKKASTPLPVSKEPLSRSVPTIKIEKEFGGTLGTIFFAIVAVLFPIWLQLWCNKDHCEYTKIPDLKPVLKNWRKLFDLEVALVYVGFQLLYALLSILPIGGRIVEGPLSKYGKIRLRANGLFSFVVVTAIIFGLEYKNIRALNLIYEKQFQFLIVAIIFGIAQAIFLYIRSSFVPLGSLNVQANTDSRFYNFFMGCELNPRIFGLFDVKQLLIRTSAHVAVLIYLAYLVRSAGVISPFDLRLETIVVKPTLITICLIQMYFFIDVLIFENIWLSSFEIQSEGVGFMSTVGYGIWPFSVTLIGKYIFEHNIERPLWVLAIIVILYAIGLTIYHGSNSQKHEFRKNPFNPALAHLETIPTMQGKKLLVSGYWGVVRHPNYAGDILMELAWSSIAPLSPAALVALPFALAFFIHRAARDHARCKQKYGSAWDRYCERVKYVLIPKVY
ncbi:delta(14)-sterol reductase TM7SF2 isoform X2 [Chrysoperla carnea]|uniref:delta(14)-sterol reductase TM7SF2 isoform X2 n=1 Tax=Chrysoperla carnea TaxID=189513 RepID=UPI001D080ACF|nr:delta(14)-sterol reductase TM7SF2 isoform X2 [Chrysoperla carnea]